MPMLAIEFFSFSSVSRLLKQKKPLFFGGVRKNLQGTRKSNEQKKSRFQLVIVCASVCVCVCMMGRKILASFNLAVE